MKECYVCIVLYFINFIIYCTSLYIQVDLEIESLREKLNKARFALSQTQTQMELHRIRTRQVVMAWRIRIHEAEERLRLQRREHDSELNDITAQLLFFEGQLKREQQDIRAMLNDKDKLIEQQQAKISELRKINADLQRELENVNKALAGDTSLQEMDIQETGQATEQVIEKVTSGSCRAAGKPKKSRRISSSFYRTFSLPSCMNTADINDLVADSSYPESDVDDYGESHENGRVQGRRGGLTKSRSQRIIGTDTYDVIERRNLSRSEQDLRKAPDSLICGKYDVAMDEDFNNSTKSLDSIDSSSRAHVIERKSETSRYAVKRTFMRPRDVKKRSKLRFRSASLKTDQSKDISASKRFFSFTF